MSPTDSTRRAVLASSAGVLNLTGKNTGNTYAFVKSDNRLEYYPIDTYSKLRHITEDKYGNIWISSTSGILVCHDADEYPENMTFREITRESGNKNSLSNNDVQMINCMNDSVIYAVTLGGGLNRIINNGDSVLC